VDPYFSDSQAALKTLSSPKVNSRLVAECLDALSVLSNRNEVILIRVPGHCGIPGNEKVDKLARPGAAMMLLGPEPALGIPSVQQESQSRNGPRFNTTLPGKIYQVTDMVNFLLVNHARKELMTCLN
jgi:hypothetical protein